MANEYTPRIKQIIDLFKGDKLYNACLNDGELNECRVFRRYNKKVVDTEWLDVIEDALNSLDVIVRNPRKFIVVEEDLIDTSRAKFVTIESVKYLAQHTNLITGIEDDMVIPSKLLNSSKEESYEVYENRFVYTLLKKLYAFIRPRYEALKNATMQSDQMEISINRKYPIDNAQITFRLDTIIKMPFEEVKKLSKEDLMPIERVAKIYNIVSGFLTTPFAKEMVSCEPVRPPIQRTNAILKNPDLNKALMLWEYISAYDEEGYDIKAVTETSELNPEMQTQYRLLVFLNSVILQNFTTTKLRVDRIASIPDSVEVVYQNPEDYVTNDFSLGEVRNIATYFSEENELSDKERLDISSAIDRALGQFKINSVRRDKAERERLVLAQRKKEKAHLEREVKLREKERENLARKAKKEEKERLKEENERIKQELELEKSLKREEIEKTKRDSVAKSLMSAQDKLDQIAEKKAKSEAYQETKEQRLARYNREIAVLQNMRNKLKKELLNYVDDEFDAINKKLSKLLGVK